MSIKLNSQEVVTSRAGFKPDPKIGNLCLGKLTKVEVVYYEHGLANKDGSPSKSEFAGLNVPALRFEFIAHKPANSQETDRFFTFDEKTPNMMYGEKKVTKDEYVTTIQTMWKRILHIRKSYEGTPNYKEITNIPEISDIELPVDKRVEEFNVFFTAIANSFNKGKNDAPIFLTDKGEQIPMYMKLIYGISGKRIGRLSFPIYTGTGFIERVKASTKPVIEVKPNEVIEVVRQSAAAPVAKANTAPDDDIPEHLRNIIN